jgi:toxin HigB-1
VKIRNFVHKGLRRLYEEGNSRGLPTACVDKIRKMVGFLDVMEHESELRTVPSWKAHLLTGDRKETWSLHVTRNWRLTFRISDDEKEILDVNFEDYH